MRKNAKNRMVLRTQREVLRRVMLGDARGNWLTLRELALRTRYGEASISAQLRHLRKPEFGGFVVEKRQRSTGTVAAERGTVWEYRLGRRRRSAVGRRRIVR